MVDIKVILKPRQDIKVRLKPIQGIKVKDSNKYIWDPDVAQEFIEQTEEYMLEAKQSEENAKLSETNAKASEINAKQSEDNAKASETHAHSDAQESLEALGEIRVLEQSTREASESARVSSESARQSEINASTSELNAKQSEENAKASEIESQRIETAVYQYLDIVREYSESASASASSSEASALASEQAKDISVDARDEAIARAEEAISASNIATEKSDIAIQKAQESLTYSNNARQSELNAKASEDNAEDYKDRCEEIFSRIGTAIKIKGRVNSLEDLPMVGNLDGDAYLVGEEGLDSYPEYYWYQNHWEFLGTSGGGGSWGTITGNIDNQADLMLKFDNIDDKIKEIELFKFPNATIIGEPTIQNGQVSNFSTVSYLQFPFILDLHEKAFQIDMCFTTATNVQVQQNILDSKFGLALAIKDGKGIMAISSNGTSWDIGSTTGSINIQSNTTYYARLIWNRLQYKTQISTDGVNYVDDMVIVDTRRPYPRTMFIGGCDQLETGHTGHPFLGTINMNKCSLSVMGNVIWQGMDDAGLSTRADISLSNLDEVGEARFNAKQNVQHFIIKEDMFDLEFDATKGVSPYNTSYGYTNVTIHEDTGVKWIEGAMYTFVLDTKVSTSANRNVRVRIGTDGDWKPVMVTSSIASGTAVFIKAINNIFFYKTTYQTNGALHCFYDTNTTYTINYSLDAGQKKAGVGAYAVSRYSLIMQKPDMTWEKITDTSKTYSTGTTKTVNKNGFLLNQIRYYNYTTNYANGELISSTYMYAKSASVNGSYSFNCGTAPGWAIGDCIYLVGTIKEDGLFYLDETKWWDNALPTTNDGKLYILLGNALTTTDSTFSLIQQRPILYHDGTSIREYIVHDDAKQDVSTAVNYNNITNCITEIPQDIKLELDNGTLTLKAGSKVYVPNGKNTDGSNKFDVIGISSDIDLSNAWGTAEKVCVYINSNRQLTIIGLARLSSGSTAPTATSTQLWYDTTNNLVKKYVSGSLSEVNCSLPVAICTKSSSVSDTKISSIDQVFNGFGYIGSTVFALPGVKGLIPNGRNENGSLKNIDFTLDKVLTRTDPTYTGDYIFIVNNNALNNYLTSAYYDYEENINKTLSGGIISGCFCGTFSRTSGVVSNFAPKTTFHAVDYNDFESKVDKSDLTEVVVLKTSYVNGKSGYNIWSNGYCEQWGYFSSESSSINKVCNFVKTFKDTNYNVLTSVYTTKTKDGYVYLFGSISARTTSSITVKLDNNTNYDGCYWRVSGYLASGQY